MGDAAVTVCSTLPATWRPADARPDAAV